jgi:uncharacterized Zn-binding protein involved in type VI secretion
MPEVSTHVDLCEGHDACPPRAFATHSPNVTAEGFQVTRQDDSFEDHGCSQHPPHSAVVTFGWQTVLANGHPVACVRASVSCPSGRVRTGRPSVLVGEGRQIKLK